VLVEFLSSETAAYAGGGAAAFGLVLFLVSFIGGKRPAGAVKDDQIDRSSASNTISETDFLSAAPPTPGPPPPVAPEPIAAATSPVSRSATAQRVFDLTEIRSALEVYRSANGAYPKSNGWQGYGSAYCATLGDKWIRGLVPDFIAALPRDPSRSEHGDKSQYLYFSDGANFKLLAHETDDYDPAGAVSDVEPDPLRPNDFGYWTEGGVSF